MKKEETILTRTADLWWLHLSNEDRASLIKDYGFEDTTKIYLAEHTTKPAEQLEGEIKLRNDVKVLRIALEGILDVLPKTGGVYISVLNKYILAITKCNAALEQTK